MSLPLKSPIQPQLARSRKELPVGDQWAYEPKYDGFRAIAFVDGDEWTIQSRSGRPLLRYFPELRFPPGRYILDGEIVIDSDDGHEDFDALQNRLHPAESRVQMLAEQTPARYVAFDILALDDDALLDKPFEERRQVLEQAFGDNIDVTPLTTFVRTSSGLPPPILASAVSRSRCAKTGPVIYQVPMPPDYIVGDSRQNEGAAFLMPSIVLSGTTTAPWRSA